MIAFRITASEADEDRLVALLWELGTEGAEVQPAEPGRLTLLAYFQNQPELADRLRARLADAGPVLCIEPAEIPKVDWVEEFRSNFEPLSVGSFWIAPPWRRPVFERPRERLIIIDPGQAFGTGTHESTRLCLAALEELEHEAPLGRTIDLGAGTGILALAAAQLGAHSVTAVDIDLACVTAAQHHAALNASELHVVRGNAGQPFSKGRFDLVLANLTSALLIERRDEIGDLCAPRARIVLSGLLVADLDLVTDAYSSLGLAHSRLMGEWAALLVKLP